ncbi:MAG: thiamine-monophosphate kinase [Candidatus Omnitrophica bacterium]|nr:thiamine-monophosphate kinase [Candidatus Omnitrophota bacterium]
MNELQWIEYLKKASPTHRDVIVGIGDDCAIVKGKGRYLLFTSDLFIEHVHFTRRGADFKQLGKRAASRALSDIVACGGVPKYLGISAGIPKGTSAQHMRSLFTGIKEYCRKYKIDIVGGDTSQSSVLFLDIWAVGETKKYVLRSTAVSGDYIFVTGPLGRLKFDQPCQLRAKEIQALVKAYKVTSMIDISDGFVLDLYRILQASRKGALLWSEEIPLTRGKKDLYRGEDYELLFTVDRRENIAQLAKKYFLVGRIKNAAFGYKIASGGKNEDVSVKGYLHF